MAWFTFTDASAEVFLIQLRDEGLIAHARELIGGTTASDPLIGGIIEKTPAPYNIGWSFHLDPQSLFFFETSTEVGDSTMRYIEDHLAKVGGALLPGNVWTGWTSILLNELSPQTGSCQGDVIFGSNQPDILFGRDGGDTLVGRFDDDYLIGGRGDDRGFGGHGNDKLSGGAGCDRLSGGSGADVLVGGTGNDHLRGGEGHDTFIFTANSGRDVIADFIDTNGSDDDVIDLRAYGFGSKAEIGMSASASDLILHLGSGNTVRIMDYLHDHSANQIINDLLI